MHCPLPLPHPAPERHAPAELPAHLPGPLAPRAQTLAPRRADRDLPFGWQRRDLGARSPRPSPASVPSRRGEESPEGQRWPGSLGQRLWETRPGTRLQAEARALRPLRPLLGKLQPLRVAVTEEIWAPDPVPARLDGTQCRPRAVFLLCGRPRRGWPWPARSRSRCAPPTEPGLRQRRGEDPAHAGAALTRLAFRPPGPFFFSGEGAAAARARRRFETNPALHAPGWRDTSPVPEPDRVSRREDGAEALPGLAWACSELGCFAWRPRRSGAFGDVSGACSQEPGQEGPGNLGHLLPAPRGSTANSRPRLLAAVTLVANDKGSPRNPS
ncbi:Hypothetical predicted protein [Marmota monax]|uniref:Uncharacterized protein n=1 Tax=Marmota monax TaxID=9995 RepID=A0A5E4AJP1_MARMO|nr:Hypothetical predicted protein [Marmota monax]